MYKKPCQESGLCNSSYARYSEKLFTQTYKALYGDAILCPSQGHKYGGRKPTLEELIRIKVKFTPR